MKTTSHTFALLLVAALLLASLPAPISPLHAQAPDDPPRLPAFACSSGATSRSDSLCLAVPVQLANGDQAIGALVRATFKERSITALADQPANMPVGSAVATLDISELGARPGDMILLQVQWGQQQIEQLVGLTPKAETRTYVLDPIIIGGAGELGHKPISGTVAWLDDRTPITGATVRLFRGNDANPIAETKTSTTVGQQPTFELDPGSLPNDTLLRLEASAVRPPQNATLSKTTTEKTTAYIVWVGRPISVPMVLGWGCLQDIPSHRGGYLPESFCLSGRSLLNDLSSSDVEVSIQLDGAPALLTRTTLLEETGEPGFSVDIGGLTNGKSLDKELTITAVKDGMFGQVTVRLEDLGVSERYGAWIEIPMREEHGSAAGLRGGTPRPVALVGSGNTLSRYLGLEGGGVVGQFQADGAWLRLLGNHPQDLPAPEVSALLGLGLVGDQDWLLAGTRSGGLALSQTGGTTWATALTGMGPITALALAPDKSAVYAADRTTLLRRRLNIAAQPPLDGASEIRQTLSFTPTALAVAADGRIFAGAADGLRVSLDGGVNWAALRSEPVTALRIRNPGASSPQLLVGTANGLFRTNADGSSWSAAGLSQPILGLAADDAGATLAATTPDGLFQASAASLNWSQVASSDTLSSGKDTTGTPDVLDLTLIPETSELLAATSTGVAVSSDGGLNWDMFDPPVPGGTVRSLTPLPSHGLLALTAQGLYRLESGSGFGQDAKWTPVSGLPVDALNGSVVRASQDGSQILLGRGAGPGDSLYVSQDGGSSWEHFSLGINRGVTGIAFLPAAVDGVAAIIATDGDGIFGWRPGPPTELLPLPALPSGPNERVAALLVAPASGSAPCEIVVGTFGAPGRIASRLCDRTSGWTNSRDLPAGAVQALAVTPGAVTPGAERVFFAATSEGVFKGAPAQGWQQIPGLAMRPMSLLAPANYDTKHLLVAGGAQAGVLLFSDTAPDVQATLLASDEARGGEVISYTVELRNRGLLPITNGTATLSFLGSPITLDPPGQPLVYSNWSLSSGQVLSYTITARANLDVKPSQVAEAEVIVGKAPNELFDPNNSAKATTKLRYRSGTDLEVRLGGTLMTSPGRDGSIVIPITNMGDRDVAVGGIVTLTLPPTVTLRNITPAPLSSVNGKVIWRLAAFKPGQTIDNLRLSYRLPVGTPADAALPIRAELTAPIGGDDRELLNNVVEAALRVAPAEPEVLVLTNFSRMSLDAEARAELTTYVEQANGLELALDSEGLCRANSKNSLACRYESFDKARAQLADRVRHGSPADPAYTNDVLRLSAAAVTARNDLVAAIRQYIQKAIGQRPPRYLYIIGGDDVIPSAAYRDKLLPGQALSLESSHAEALEANDSLYSVLRANHYVSDKAYEQIGSARFFIGRQPGTSAEIAAVLKLYQEQGGELNIQRGNVAGWAWQLTENTQRAVCQLFRLSFADSEQQSCNLVPTDAISGLPRLALGNTMSSLSGHADQYVIGGLTSAMIEASSLGAINVLLLLGCHSGLVPNTGLYADRSLVEAFAAQGQPVFGYTGFAYASKVDGATPGGLIYGERLQMLLIKRLLQRNLGTAAELTLGQVRAYALDDYRALSYGKLDGLSTKTLDTLMLYGPPTYRLRQPNAAPIGLSTLATAPSARVAQGPAATSITLSPTFSPNASAEGTFFLASVPSADTWLQTTVGHTIQPVASVPLPETAAGVRITGGMYHDIPGVDPVIPRIGPLDPDSVTYTEPAYLGSTRDWTLPAVINRDADGAAWAMIGLGQWTTRGQTERLIDSLSLEVLTTPQPETATPPTPGQVKIVRGTNGAVTVTVIGSKGATAADVVLFENGAVRVVPMYQNRSTWEAVFQAQAGSQFLLQLLSDRGAVIFDTNLDLLYTIPSSATNTPVTLQIEPVSGSRNYPVAYHIRNTGKEPVDLRWSINCRSPWESYGLCSDSDGAVSLDAGESVTRGLGMICASWDLQLEWRASQRGNLVKWSSMAAVPASCGGAQQIKPPPASSGLRIEAEHYARYQDIEAANVGDAPAYRAPGPDIYACPTTCSGGHKVGAFYGGEWLEFDVVVRQSQAYTIVLRYGTRNDTSIAQVLIDGQPATDRVRVASTGHYDRLSTQTLGTVTLTAGVHRVRVIAHGPYSFDYLEFLPTGAAP